MWKAANRMSRWTSNAAWIKCQARSGRGFFTNFEAVDASAEFSRIRRSQYRRRHECRRCKLKTVLKKGWRALFSVPFGSPVRDRVAVWGGRGRHRGESEPSEDTSP